MVPLRPPQPLKTMTPLFMMPQEPFGHLGQNFGALGGSLNIDQKQQAPHRQPLELVPTRGARTRRRFTHRRVRRKRRGGQRRAPPQLDRSVAPSPVGLVAGTAL
ncbi:MAG: hypothetical protein QM775_13485 [Pirellulales bacterium]